MKEEIDPDVELDRIDNNSSDKNPFRELKVNNTGKIESRVHYPKWNSSTILSNVINYVQYSKNPKKMFHAMSIKPINKNKSNEARKEGEKDRFTSRDKSHEHLR